MQTVIPVRRDNVLLMLQNTPFSYSPEKSDQILEYLERTGVIRFNGPMLETRDVSHRNAFIVEGIANLTLGRTMGSQGTYKLKEYINGLILDADKLGIVGKRR